MQGGTRPDCGACASSALPSTNSSLLALPAPLLDGCHTSLSPWFLSKSSKDPTHHSLGIAENADLQGIVTTELPLIDFDLNDLRLRREVALIEEGGEMRQPSPDGQDDVGVPDRFSCFGRSGTAERTDDQRMVMRYGIITPVGCHHGSAELFSHGQHFGLGIRPNHPASSDDDGRYGLI